MTTTCIRNASWIVAWDEARQSHAYRRDADVAFADGGILYVGPRFEGTPDVTVDGRDRLVMPGLIDIHSHPSIEPLGKGYFEDLGSPQFFMSRLYEHYTTLLPDAEASHIATDVALAEALLSGCTTLVDFAFPYPGWIERLAASGLRAYAAPLYMSANWRIEKGADIQYSWDEAAGEKGLETALDLVTAAERHPSGRLAGLLGPATVDTCSEALLRASKKAAAERGITVQVHACVGLNEFLEIVRRTGVSPIQWLDQIGFLGPETTLAHTLFIDTHPWLHWHTECDIGLIAQSGSSVAHMPLVAAQRGVLLHSFGKYRKAGINIALGTDTYPLNMMEEMRWAGILSKVASGHVNLLRAEDVFHAATIGSARALGRDDIGRLAPGAKADIVLVDLDHPAMMPVRDPLRSLIYTAAERPVRDVYVDGVRVVADRVVTTIPQSQRLAELQVAQAKALARVSERDWAGRSAEEVSPLSLPMLS